MTVTRASSIDLPCPRMAARRAEVGAYRSPARTPGALPAGGAHFRRRARPGPGRAAAEASRPGRARSIYLPLERNAT